MKYPQTLWLKTTDVYFVTVPKARSPKSKRWQGLASSEGPEKNPSSCLPASGGSRHSLASGGTAPVSVSVSA